MRPEASCCSARPRRKALLGRAFRLMARARRVPATRDLAPVVIATIHPSAILRARDGEARQAQLDMLIDDLRVAAQALARPARAEPRNPSAAAP